MGFFYSLVTFKQICNIDIFLKFWPLFKYLFDLVLANVILTVTVSLENELGATLISFQFLIKKF